jgi:hypothetical protein
MARAIRQFGCRSLGDLEKGESKISRRGCAASRVPALAVTVAGSLVGVLIASWAHSAVLGIVPPSLQAFAVAPLDTRILSVTFGVALLSAVVAGALPAVSLSRVEPLAALRSDAESFWLSRRLKTGSIFLASAAAFGVVIITAAAATVPPFLNFLIRPPGFEPQDLFTVRVNHRWADGGLVGDPNRAERMDAVLDVMDGVPHVQSAAAALALPFGEPVGASEFWRPRTDPARAIRCE